MKYRVDSKKPLKGPKGLKNDDFCFCLFRFHIFTLKQNFLVFIKISYLQRFLFSRKNNNFGEKKSPQVEKITFRIFFVAHLPIEKKLFIKFSYLQWFREIMGGQDSVTTEKQ